MKFEMKEAFDSIKDETKEIAETTHEKTNEFHENYVSDLLPDAGKYGDAAKFFAEMVPGVSEYNAIRDGDWVAFALAAGMDTTAIAIGIATLGTGCFAEKGAELALKEALEGLSESEAKEVLEKVAAGEGKEILEKLAKGEGKDVLEDLAEGEIKDVVEEGAETTVKEVEEISQVVKNKLDGIRREEEVLKELGEKYGEDNVIREVLLRDSTGKPIKDFVTNEARRIDMVVIDGKKVIRSIEVTSEDALKGVQMAKEWRIREQAKALGGLYIKITETGELIKFGEEIATEIVRLK